MSLAVTGTSASRLGLVAGALCAFGCGAASPQTSEEAAITYRVSLTAEPGVVTRVTFPWIADGASAAALAGMQTSDGGTVRLETSQDGEGFVLEGKGHVEASYHADRARGLGTGNGIPEAALTRAVADGGTEERILLVNKGGAASAQVEFEYTAVRNCGSGCGGTRSWKFAGPVGISRQIISMQFSEEQRK